MSSHDSALAMIDNQIEKEEESRKRQETLLTQTRLTLKRQEDEMKVIEWSLKQLQNSRACLLFDRSANSVEA